MTDLPLFPLGTVLFPGGLLPLRLFEQRYLEMAKACLRDGTPFGVCLIREGAEVGAPATPEPVGCTARIAQWDMQQLGLLQIVAHGEQRFRILERQLQDDGLARARVELLPPETDEPVPERHAACPQLLERLAAEHGERVFARPWHLDSSAWVSARLAEILPLPKALKQQMLELDDSVQRLEILQRYLSDLNR
ncbi:MAG: LON peptidase substrate-binding domain-containing protein [Burkholderiales bacterium]